jgi:hypothetical protein
MIDAGDEEMFAIAENCGRAFEQLRDPPGQVVNYQVIPGINHYGIYFDGCDASSRSALACFEPRLWALTGPLMVSPMNIETRKSVETGVGRLQVQLDGPQDGRLALLWPSLFTDGPATWGLQLDGLRGLGWRTALVDPPGQGAAGPVPASSQCGSVAAWQNQRNASHTKANWQFLTENARIKLKHLYPSI